MNSAVLEPRMRSSFGSDEACWAAVARRDRDADGRFYYAVSSTGIYCRPSCSSRLPLRRNVVFFATCAAAEIAGFRPCKRCKPGEASVADVQTAKVTEACRIIAEAEEMPSLEALAEAVGLSPFHFHRVFKSITGLTPKAYAAGHRGERVRAGLARGDATLTTALYDAGFNSNARFYATADQLLGMPPKRFRAGGAGAVIRFAIGASSLGAILVAATEIGVCATLLGDDPEILVHELQDRFPKAQLIGGDIAFEQLVARVVGFVEAPRLGLDLPLDLQGTAFQQRVWQALQRIPLGSTASYSDIARALGAPQAARAVAQACAANPVALAIPCHRVVRRDGDVSGYRWGVERKRALLSREAASAPRGAGALDRGV